MAILTLPYTGVASAATWQSAIAVPSTVEYDSNPLLLTRDEKSVTRTIIAPDYSLVGNFGRDELQFGLGVNVVRSSDTSVVTNREDPRLRLGWQRETETGAYGLTARYEESSTLSTAIQETGVVSADDGTQKFYSLGANWRTALSERSTLIAEADYNHVTYDVTTLIDYDELATRLTWNYAWSERVEVFTRFGATRYEPDETSVATSSNSYTPTVGVNVQFSDQFKGSVYAGLNQVSGTGDGPTGQGGVMLQYTGDRVESSIDASRSTVASGDGGFVEADILKGTWSYAIDEVRRTGFDASWQDTQGQTPNTLSNYSVWVSQELSPFWMARLSFTYKERKQDNFADATANVVGLTLVYSYPGL